MSQPVRPVLKPGDRKDSKVRFSREELAPVRTDPSDFLPHHEQPPSARSSIQRDEEYYDTNSYPFSAEPVELSESQDLGEQQHHQQTGYYRTNANEEEEQVTFHHPEERQYEVSQTHDDVYTPSPARVGSRRWSIAQHRPTLDTLLSAEEVEDHQRIQSISPRNSQVVQQTYDPASGSPYARSPSVLRSSLANTNAPPQGSPRQQQSYSEYDHSAASPLRSARASAPTLNYTPPRRMLEQHRYSVSAAGSPNAQSARQEPIHDAYSPGFKRYDGERRLSPAPPYPSEEEWNRNSGYGYDQNRENEREREKDKEWQDMRDQGFDRQREMDKKYGYSGRRSSDETLYDDEKRGAGGGGKYSSDDRDRVQTRRQRSLSDASKLNIPSPHSGGMRRRTTREVEEDDDDSSYHVKGGVFSQLLRLTGRTNTMRRRMSSKSGAGASSAGPGMLPTMKSLGLRRLDSTASTAYGADELDMDDPRITGQKKKRGRRNSLSDLPFMRTGTSDSSGPYGRRKRRASIQLHVADILTRQQFVLKLAKALMTFGAPSHRIESQLSATSLVLEIDAQFIHFPSIVIASFGDMDTRTSETHFVKVTHGGLELGKLHKVHNIYKSVVHDEMDAAEGTRKIQALIKAPMEYKLWHRMILAFLCSGLIAPVGFGGSFVDGCASGCLGILLSFMQLHVASKSAMYSNIFEISIATVISFTARGLSTTGIFCYQAVASAGVVLILPGYTILCGSLELASKNIVSGSVRMVYAIIYSLFLGFGITIGSDLFYVLDRPARRASQAALAAAQSYATVHGSFYPEGANGLAQPLFNGTFTFSNATTDQITSNLQQGAIICVRDPSWPWYRQGMPQIYLILFVPFFSVLLSMWNMQPLRSRQLPVMCAISCVGYFTNVLGNHYIFDRSDVVSALGAFMIGILGNIYSRVFGGTAFTSMVTGVLFLVPSGIAAAGGLAMTQNPHHGDSYSQGLIIGFRMVQVAIGITVGLFGSGLLVYAFGRKKGAALFAF
ncbi:hypothetical protein CI109_102766 [Kwoniella shandongensis]|uniref:Uncharacterized protein n=1 Tax=Kwoniella shandongensis TaxID=1734106 RepID=A0A5M6C0H0_9TREE|nr:uncharacterized protein CI109_004912 [Kwoniella shandongensis]KAA5526709.1 hypothetical protein CI109_004912 [Kwoniella shandongensis]